MRCVSEERLPPGRFDERRSSTPPTHARVHHLRLRVTPGQGRALPYRVALRERADPWPVLRADRCALTVRRHDSGRCRRQGKSACACQLSDRSSDAGQLGSGCTRRLGLKGDARRLCIARNHRRVSRGRTLSRRHRSREESVQNDYFWIYTHDYPPVNRLAGQLKTMHVP